MSKKLCFRGPFNKQDGKRAKPQWKSASQDLYNIHWSLASKLSSKEALFLTCQILGLLFNTFPVDEKYPVLNRDNLTIPIEMQLSQKEKKFSRFLAVVLKSRINFQYFEKNDDPHRFCNFEITESKNVVR